MLDHLEKPDVDIVNESHRIIDNLAHFHTWLNNIEDPNAVWDGIQRLEIVAITLAQGQDNPQLIFESMNSTGKDLSTADLVRNFVLMGLPMDEQEELYSNYWRKIEETLGADSYDQIFDDFLRNWLTVLHAPTSIVARDVYRIFKRYVSDNRYDQPGQMASLLKDIRRFAGYYSQITAGTCEDKELRLLFDRIASLDVSVVNPLLMELSDDFDAEVFSHEDFVSMLHTVESYLFRRSVCDLATNSLNKFFSSVIARLKGVRENGGSYREAFEAFLLGEEGTARRMPSDADFERALKTRDCYAFKRGFYLLSTLENSYHSKDPLNFASGTFTIEHIMPQNALNNPEWRKMLGSDCERVHEELINTLGNLTLTAYNSELSDASFDEKKTHIVGGYEEDYLVISKELKCTDVWDESAIRNRADRLAKRALQIWPAPTLAQEVIFSYKPEKKTAGSTKPVSFRTVCLSTHLEPGAILAAEEAGRVVHATVTENYTIRLDNGDEAESPSRAAERAKELVTGKHHSINGWRYWHVGEGGPLLAEVRSKYLEAAESASSVDVRAAFWDGFYEYCASRQDFLSVYRDPTGRPENTGWYADFGFGLRGVHATTLFSQRDAWVGVGLWFTDVSLYEGFAPLRGEAERMLEGLDGEISWREPGKSTRELLLKWDTSLSPEHWSKLYVWLVNGLLKMRLIAELLQR